MLMANEAVARRMADCGIPLLYRVHDRPDADRLGAYARLAGAFGHRFPKTERISPIGIQGFLEGLQGKPTQRVLSSQLLRSMKKAVYTPENIGHFGLACPCYTHFTSPIRRYPDLLVHRLLKESLSGPITGARRAHLEKHLPAIGDRATQCEITAKEAEWGALKSKQIRYLEQRIGEPFRATIVKVSSSGFYCELDKVLIDGFVRASSLTDDYYSHIEDRGAMVGKHTGRTFTLGDSVQVRLAAADSRRRRIDLLVEEGGRTARRDRIEKVPKVRKNRKYHPSRKRRSPGRR